MQTDFLTARQAAEFLGLKKNTLDIWRLKGKGPNYTRLGKAVRYRMSDLEKFIADNTVENRNEGCRIKK